MFENLVVGLTGSIGSGKSTVANLFKKWGADVVDADQLAREVVAPGSIGLKKLVELFSENILSTDGSLDRKALGRLIFKDPNARKKVEEYLHPLIRERWLSYLATWKNSHTSSIIVYMVPLLFESGIQYNEIDKIVLVSAPREVCIARVTNRDGLSQKEAIDRLDAQLTDDEKSKRSDFIIENPAGLKELEVAALRVWDLLVALSKEA